MYAAIAARSSALSCEVLCTTSVIGPPTRSPSAVMPVSSVSAIAAADHLSNLRWVISGKPLRPEGVGLPVKRFPVTMAPARLRGLWHSAQWPGPLTRYAPRFHCADCDGSGVIGPASRYSSFQPPTRRRMLYGNDRSWSRVVPATGGNVLM